MNDLKIFDVSAGLIDDIVDRSCKNNGNATRWSPIQVLTFLGVKGKGLLTGFRVHLRFKLRTPLVNSFLLFASVPTGGQEQTVIS